MPFRTLLVAVAALVLVSQLEDAAAEELRMSYNSDWPPYSAGVGDTVRGILPTLMAEIAEKRMGIKVAHVGYPWKRAQNAVKTGNLDAFVTVPTEARLAYALSSQNVVYSIHMHPIVAVGSAAEQKISAVPKPSTLRALSVCDIIGNGWGKAFAARHEITPIMATKVAACFRMIARGRTEVSVQAMAVANQTLASENLKGQLNILPNRFGEMKFTLLLSKKSPLGTGFMRRFDETLNAMIADGSYATLIQRLRDGAY